MAATVQQIEALTSHAVTFSGGGRGQVAQAQMPDGSFAAVKAGSKQEALEGLLVAVWAELRRTPIADAAADRPTVEDALAALGVVFGEFDVNEEDENRTPRPMFKGTSLVAIVPCVGECMFGTSDVCDCRCGGANHAIAQAGFLSLAATALLANDKAAFKQALSTAKPVMYGSKPCLCGCGELTLRRFAPGHDARYHAAQKRQARAKAAGISLVALAALDKAARLQKAKDRRAAKKAA